MEKQDAQPTIDATLLPTRCDWCPRRCGANRAAGEIGVCGADNTLRIARAALHHWEEPPISGESGSGTVFFSYCPLRCVYCQNRHIALGDTGAAITLERLVEIFLELEEQGALNLNMVTPTHYAPLIAEAIRKARSRGMGLPVVWNTSGYETPEAIAALDGIVDVYLTDFKYADAAPARAYSHAANYPSVAYAALEAMITQVGTPQFDDYHGQTRLIRGVVVRHLLLPGHLNDSHAVVAMLASHFRGRVLISLMNQYTPVIDPDDPTARQFPNLLLHPSSEEYELLLDYADNLGLDEYFWQDGEADRESFIPSFDMTGVVKASPQ